MEYEQQIFDDPDTMTDRELMVEMVRRLRRIEETVSEFLDSMSKNPVLSMMAGKMMGR